jgi:hypothetical protein
MGEKMMLKSCEEYDYLPYYYSWARHCGGNAWEFMTRSMGLLGSAALAAAGGASISTANPIGVTFGLSLLGKSANDAYESWTGKRGIVRDLTGDPLYEGIDLALIAYGGLRSVPKINYLGNPKRDFFTRDPLTYESAFRQFSVLELNHFVLSTAVTLTNDYRKFSEKLAIEDAWNEHICRVRACNK